MPILKQLAPQPSKRRPRLDLTRDMISAPLGDFRHTMHVGRGGDAFGDTSFLVGGRQDAPPPADGGGLTSPHLPPQLPEEGGEVRGQGTDPSPEEGGEVRGQGTDPSPEEGGEVRGQGTDSSPEEAGAVRRSPPPGPQPALKHAESVLSFHVDLGPSMLGDILGVMEKGPAGSPGTPDPGIPRTPEEEKVEVEEEEESSSTLEADEKEKEEEEEEGECYTFEEEQEDEINV